MLLQKETILTENHRAQINELLEACRKSGGEGVPYPVDDEDCCHYLLWADEDAVPAGKLSGVLGIFPLSEGSAECMAYVRPEERRRGLFSQVMLPAASDDFRDLEFVFPVRGNIEETADAGILAVLNSIGAEYDCTEYKMELTLDAPSDDASPDRTSGPSDLYGEMAGFSGAGYHPGSPDVGEISFTYIYPPDAASSDVSISHCNVQMISAGSVCLTDVETSPVMRGRGYGTAMMRSLTEELKKRGIRHITVHVSGENIPAVSLYEKTGFRTTETLSYFIF